MSCFPHPQRFHATEDLRPAGDAVPPVRLCGAGFFSSISSTKRVIGNDLAQCCVVRVTTLTIDGPKGIRRQATDPQHHKRLHRCRGRSSSPRPEGASRSCPRGRLPGFWCPSPTRTGSITLTNLQRCTRRVNHGQTSSATRHFREGPRRLRRNPLWPDGQQVSCLVFNADGSISMDDLVPLSPTPEAVALGPIGLQFTADRFFRSVGKVQIN